ncbi:MAG: GTPase [Candidatus Promineifilaceae bacterium]
MNTRTEMDKRFSEGIRELAKKMNIPKPAEETAIRDALLKSAAFARYRRPIIAVTGVTHTGKSSLINALFEEKKLTIGLTSNTTDVVYQVQFESGLLIYDTPGGGGDEKFENVTRAFLKIPQIDKDSDGNILMPLKEIPFNDISANQWVNKPISDFEELDLIIFVVSIETGIRRDDKVFYKDVASTGKPMVVVINKSDLAESTPEKILQNIDMIEREMRVKAIPISAQTGAGLDKLASAIHHKLPLETSKILGETVDISLKKIMRHRQIEVDVVVSAIKTASLIDKKNQITDFIQLAANILGLYGHIVSQYRASDMELSQADIDIAGLWRNVDKKMEETPSTATRTAPMIAVGVTFGAIVATVATGGLAAIPIAIGAGSGLGISGAVGIVSSVLHRSETFETAIRSEMKKQVKFVGGTDRFQIACSVVAFGHTLRECCEQIEQKNESEKFSAVFEREYARTLQELKPFTNRIKKVSSEDEENLVRDIVAQYFRVRKGETNF